MDLLDNAIKSIQMGIEDFEDEDSKRAISAVRNIYSGDLLLFKYFLSEKLTDEEFWALKKAGAVQNSKERSDIIFKKDNRTIGFSDLAKICHVLFKEGVWENVKALNKARNDVEHHYSEYSPGFLCRLVSNNFAFLKYLIEEKLEEDPIIILGEKYWNILKDTEGNYKILEKKCINSLNQIQWWAPSFFKLIPWFQCPEFSSHLLETEEKGDFHNEMLLGCSECGNKIHAYEILEETVSQYFEPENYISVRYGGDSLTGICPECQLETYIFEDDICLSCGYKRLYTECARCHDGISIEEQDFGGLCGYCYNLCIKDD
ncbi:hypothetical protein LWC08_03735 [Desulfobaculum bizertense]|uniref:hypothetical protein n=1 Tax=Desulfobaculum bizertense TaxID=376490 RepID=UPI001F2EDB43|nr:hypothetical protein [Desulfobaculum bizertense]UIJ38690.1 hypothetical protein LWC08_03735 [Desulfobaculum bizertense]